MAMQQVEGKKTEKVVFSSSLKKYISSHYSEDPATFEGDLQAIDELRAKATSSFDPENLAKYYYQLQCLGSKFPINEKGVKINFSWYHSFNQRKRFSSYGLNFEKACVLFNLAASYSQKAKVQNLNTAEGQKFAFNYFQLAAGAFQTLKETIPTWFVETVSSDLSTSTLKSLEFQMVGQAQETFVLKATADKKSKSILAKLASQAADFFDKAYDAAVEPGNGFEGRVDWLTYLQVKALYYHGVANFHISSISLTEMKYGQEIARLNLSLSFLRKALELAKQTPDQIATIQDQIKEVEIRLKSANKDNDTIYLEAIPPFKELLPIGKYPMAKPSPLSDALKPSVTGHPLFAKLVPLAVMRTAGEYKSQKERLVFEQLARIDKSNASLNGMLHTMNLPSSLDALEQPIGLPESLLLKSSEVRDEGGISSMKATLDHLSRQSHTIQQTFREGLTILQKEEEEDNRLRAQYGGKWIRTPSAILNENLKTEAQKHLQMLESAQKSDAVVQSKISNNFALIDQLGSSPKDLEKVVPSSGAQQGFASSNPHISKLRSLCSEADSLKKSNETLVEEMKNYVQKDDIVPILLETYGTQTISDASECFAAQLKNYDPFISRIDQAVSAQEAIVASLIEENEKFQATKTTNEFIAKREGVLSKLNVAYDNFREIKGNLKEGLKFYSTMESLSTVFKGNCEDFALARDTEKRDLLQSVERQAAPPTAPVVNPHNLYGYTHSSPSAFHPNPSSSNPFAPSAPSSQNPYYLFPQNPYN